jgi:hypothetical protein
MGNVIYGFQFPKIRAMKFPNKKSPKVGDVNITEICKDTQKQINHFFESKLKNNTDNNESFIIKELSEKLNIPEDEVIYKVKIPGTRRCVVYGHPEFGKIIEKWSRNKLEGKEEKIRQSLEKKLSGKTTPTKAGQIDILTAEKIIEVKNVDRWKEGIGQLVVFGTMFPNHGKQLHLFGKFPKRKNTKFSTELLSFELIEEICNKLDIEVTMEADRKLNVDVSDKDELEFDLAQLDFANILEQED